MKLFGMIVGVIGFVIAIWVVAGLIGTVANIPIQASRAVNKTIDADNVINTYEWYRDAYGNFQAKTRQVNQFKTMYAQADQSDVQERNRLRIEMAAVQQSCRDLANRYNANSLKINRSIFRGTDVPENLEAAQCE